MKNLSPSPTILPKERERARAHTHTPAQRITQQKNCRLPSCTHCRCLRLLSTEDEDASASSASNKSPFSVCLGVSLCPNSRWIFVLFLILFFFLVRVFLSQTSFQLFEERRPERRKGICNFGTNVMVTAERAGHSFWRAS